MTELNQRELTIVRHKWGLMGQCSYCKRFFFPSPELRGHDLAHPEQEQQLRVEFKSHDCTREANLEGKPEAN